MVFPLIIAAVAGYLLGSLPFGWLVARARGVNIFKAGSGNPGATNIKRMLGAKAGSQVFALDALKGMAAAGWPLLLRGLGNPWGAFDLQRITDMSLVGLIAAVLGHSFSIFTRFKGGKGVATAAGGLIVIIPFPMLIGAAAWIVVFFASRYVSLASILSSVAVPAAAWAIEPSLALKLVATALGALVIVRHHSNIRRLLSGTEHRWERRKEAPAP